jgi:opacity protein-like surface antigen
MKKFLARAIVAAVSTAVLFTPAWASAQEAASVEGFGGVGVDAWQSQPASLGGRLTFDLTPGVQLIGEAGRIGSVLPTLSSTVFSLADADLHASAFYGEGGVRFLAAPRAKVTPYGEASVGMARLSVSSPRFGTIGNAAAALALTLAGRNQPLAGVGGGVLLRTGPVVFDAGYRYKQLFTNEVVQAALGFGEPLRTHQFRVGLGFRF